MRKKELEPESEKESEKAEGGTLSLSTFTYCVYMINFNYFSIFCDDCIGTTKDGKARAFAFMPCLRSPLGRDVATGLYLQVQCRIKCGSQSVEHYPSSTHNNKRNKPFAKKIYMLAFSRRRQQQQRTIHNVFFLMDFAAYHLE